MPGAGCRGRGAASTATEAGEPLVSRSPGSRGSGVRAPVLSRSPSPKRRALPPSRPLRRSLGGRSARSPSRHPQRPRAPASALATALPDSRAPWGQPLPALPGRRFRPGRSWWRARPWWRAPRARRGRAVAGRGCRGPPGAVGVAGRGRGVAGRGPCPFRGGPLPGAGGVGVFEMVSFVV
ncbi:hypothetical protein GPN2_20054 [Streptomyces murinus]